MKKILILSITVFVALFFISLYLEDDGSNDPVRKVSVKTARSLEKKYNMYWSSSLQAVPNYDKKIKIIGLGFDKINGISKENCRKIIVESAIEYLTNINQMHDYKDNFIDFPFTIDNIDVKIHFYTKDNKEALYPELNWVALKEGIINYVKRDVNYNFESEQESFQEALEIVKNESKNF